jgi:hypothetical protein
MCEEKRETLYKAEQPFRHTEMLRQSRLYCVPGLATMAINDSYQSSSNASFGTTGHVDFGNLLLKRGACVIVASHPSLRFGDSMLLANIWASNPANTMILIGMGQLLFRYWSSQKCYLLFSCPCLSHAPERPGTDTCSCFA